MTEDNTPRGELVLMDEDTQHAIYWNGSQTFNVWTVLGNSFSFRPLRNVNVFTAVYDTPDNQEAASERAQEWWAEYGRENTIELEREGL